MSRHPNPILCGVTLTRVLDVYDLMHYFALRGSFRPRNEVVHWIYGRRDVKATSRERAWERVKAASKLLGVAIQSIQNSEKAWDVGVRDAWQKRQRVGEIIDAYEADRAKRRIASAKACNARNYRRRKAEARSA